MVTKADSNAHDFFRLPDLLEIRSFLILVMMAQLLVMLLAFFKYGLNFQSSGFLKLTVYIQWQAIFSALSLNLFRGHINQQPSHIHATALSYVVLLAVSVVVSVITQLVSAEAGNGEFSVSFVLSNLLITAIVAGVGLRYLFLQQQLVHREKAAVMASLASLQARIKPHFLFNTMNSIASLIGFAPDKAEKMVEDLSALLRESLKEERVETTIEKEWGLCERYLSIEFLRLGDRLKWEADFDLLDTQLPIPSLTLQPIVENAIYHGVQPSPQAGFIRAKGEFYDGEVIISIENSQFDSAQSQRENKGNRMAIGNIRHRIKQLYGPTASLEMHDLGESFQTVLKYRPVA